MARRKVKNLKFLGYEFKSGFELLVAKDLTAKGIKFYYEEMSIKYRLPRKLGKCMACGSTKIIENRIYTPDFVCQNELIIEAKGRFTASDRTKMQLVIKQHPELDIRILFQYDNWLTTAKKTRYSRWCSRNGIKWAIKTIPQSWVDEF